MNNIYVIPRYHSHECPTIHHAIHSAFRGPICNVMGIPIQNISIVLLPLCYMSVIMWCTYCVHVTQWCRSCATPRCTLTPRVICMFVCVCVYVVNESTTPCNAKNFTARFLDSGFTFRIQIDTHWSKPYLRGRPHASFWSVCTYRRRLPKVVLFPWIFHTGGLAWWSRSSLPLRVLWFGSALYWVQSVVCQLKLC